MKNILTTLELTSPETYLCPSILDNTNRIKNYFIELSLINSQKK